jgi:hypothetical protein
MAISEVQEIFGATHQDHQSFDEDLKDKTHHLD